ncbi:MAG: hypothetical protein C0514_01740 [Candidatus Puniceispirillum sp.]|nr:hypothetical protein [Candidatus Puniceispirillum sp.]
MKKMLLTAIYLTLNTDAVLFASAQPVTILEDAQEAPAPTRLFQGERDALQAAKADFIQNPTPGNLKIAFDATIGLFTALQVRNEEDTTLFDPVAMSRFCVDAQAQERAYLQVPLELLKGTVQAHYMPMGRVPTEEARDLRNRVLSAYLEGLKQGMAFDPPTLFAGWGIAQQRFYENVSRLKATLFAREAQTAHTQLKEASRSSTFDQEFVEHFWALPKALQDVLIVTGGDKAHPEWLQRVLMSGEEAQNCEAWGAICAMELGALKKKVAPFVEVHGQSIAAIDGEETLNQAHAAIGVYDAYNTVFNATSSLYWAVEKGLLDAIMADRENSAQAVASRFMPLLEAWSDSDKSPHDRPRELIHLTLIQLMKKRFALTYMFVARAVNPAALEEAATVDLTPVLPATPEDKDA